MKYVKYKLIEGVQPSYLNGAVFSGGMYSDGNWYLGYLKGTNELMNDFINACQEFSMTELTQEDAIEFVNSIMPATSIDAMGKTLFPQEPFVDDNGYIITRWDYVPKGLPKIEDRLDAVEQVLLDIVIGA